MSLANEYVLRAVSFSSSGRPKKFLKKVFRDPVSRGKPSLDQSRSLQKDRKRHCQSDKLRRGFLVTSTRHGCVFSLRNSGFCSLKNEGAKCGRTQSFLTGFQVRGDYTEGLLGGWLAQRQAALRGMLAAGALSTFTLGRPCVPGFPRACAVPTRTFSWNSTVIDPWCAQVEDVKEEPTQAAISSTLKAREPSHL